MSRYKNKRYVSATQLAELGTCEQQAIYKFQGVQGQREDREVTVARKRGDVIHARRHRQLTTGSETPVDKRCFIATAVYGNDAWQTHALRRWRDRSLLPHGFGRLLVRCYYRVSPPLAVHLEHHLRIARCVRYLLNPVVRLAAGKCKG